MDINRRGFLRGLVAVAAPAVIRTPGLLMPVRALIKPQSVRLQWYCNRTIREFMEIEAIRDRNILLRADDYIGQPMATFRGIPIKITDDLWA